MRVGMRDEKKERERKKKVGIALYIGKNEAMGSGNKEWVFVRM